MSLTKVSYSMITGAPVNVVDFGADPTGVADSAAAIQAAFDTITTYATANQTNENAARALAKRIYFPAGSYKINSALTIGVASKVFYWCEIDMSGASIVSNFQTTSTDSVLTINYPSNCSFKGITIWSAEGSACKINNSFDSSYYDCSFSGGSVSGVNRFACLQLYGMHFNNTWLNTAFSQSAGYNGSQWAIYAKFDTLINPAPFNGAPINLFDGTHMAGCDNAIYWEGGGQITFINGEMEGFGTSGVTFKDVDKIVWAEMYQESFPLDSDSLVFDGCDDIYIRNHQTGSYYHNTQFKNCNRVLIDNYTGGSIRVVGTNEYFNLNNIKVLRNYMFQWIEYVDGGTVTQLDATNVSVINVAGSASIGKFPLITSGTFNPQSNLIANPRALDASGSITTTACTVVNDGSYQSVSTLGYTESLLTIDNASTVPGLIFTYDNTAFKSAKKILAVLAVCWKHIPNVGVTAVNTTGTGVLTNLFGSDPYNPNMYFYSGDWVVAYTMFIVDSTDTQVSVTFNYNTTYAIGTKFLFGGANLYVSSEVKIPMLY